jgi:hypothetical protein
MKGTFGETAPAPGLSANPDLTGCC